MSEVTAVDLIIMAMVVILAGCLWFVYNKGEKDIIGHRHAVLWELEEMDKKNAIQIDENNKRLGKRTDDLQTGYLNQQQRLDRMSSIQAQQWARLHDCMEYKWIVIWDGCTIHFSNGFSGPVGEWSVSR